MIMDIKMQRVIVILGVLLFPKALSALKCYECTDVGGSCIGTEKDCPASDDQCGAAVTRTYVGGTNVDVKVKGCAPSAECDVSGSMDLGITRTIVSTTCCSTDLCKVQYPTLPDNPSSPNGKKCFTCNIQDNDCSNILSCSGDEDRCVKFSMEQGGNKVTVKGCVSKSMCVGSKSGTAAGMTAHLSCCEGDLCNSATSTAVGLLLLLAAPVVSVALFN